MFQSLCDGLTCSLQESDGWLQGAFPLLSQETRPVPGTALASVLLQKWTLGSWSGQRTLGPASTLQRISTLGLFSGGGRSLARGTSWVADSKEATGLSSSSAIDGVTLARSKSLFPPLKTGMATLSGSPGGVPPVETDCVKRCSPGLASPVLPLQGLEAPLPSWNQFLLFSLLTTPLSLTHRQCVNQRPPESSSV